MFVFKKNEFTNIVVRKAHSHEVFGWAVVIHLITSEKNQNQNITLVLDFNSSGHAFSSFVDSCYAKNSTSSSGCTVSYRTDKNE